MSRTAYQVRLQRNLDQMARRTQERREERTLHGDALCRRYVDAYLGYYTGLRHCIATYNVHTGYYAVSNTPKKLTEKELTTATEWYYAATHAREIEVAEED